MHTTVATRDPERAASSRSVHRFDSTSAELEALQTSASLHAISDRRRTVLEGAAQAHAPLQNAKR